MGLDNPGLEGGFCSFSMCADREMKVSPGAVSSRPNPNLRRESEILFNFHRRDLCLVLQEDKPFSKTVNRSTISHRKALHDFNLSELGGSLLILSVEPLIHHRPYSVPT